MTIPEKTHIALLCLFCKSILEGQADAKFYSGDLIKCNNCKELNDYDSLIEVAKEKGLKQLTDQINKYAKKEFGRIFK